MFIFSDLFANYALNMRSVTKKANSSFDMDLFTSALYCTNMEVNRFYTTFRTIFQMNQKTSVIEFDDYFYNRTSALYAGPYTYLELNKNFAEYNYNEYWKNQSLYTNENAVRLDDIKQCWYRNEQDLFSLLSKDRFLVQKEESVDLDLFKIQREAQEFNDCGNLAKKQDEFFLECLFHHLVVYSKYNWFQLKEIEKYLFCYMISQSPDLASILYNQLIWFGYDCLLKSISDDQKKADEYNSYVKKVLEISEEDRIVKHFEDLAVDFGTVFSLLPDLIEACDKNFEKKNRMAYTKLFTKI